MKRYAVIAAVALLAGCAGSPTEPIDPPKKTGVVGNTNCPQAEKDLYGFCIPPLPAPPCSLLGPDGKPYPNCVP